MSLDPGSAMLPGMAPPDAQPMTFGMHLQEALHAFMARPLEASEMRDLKAFIVAIDGEIRRKQQVGQALTGPGGPQQGLPSDDTQDYGANHGSPQTEGSVPYGSQNGSPY